MLQSSLRTNKILIVGIVAMASVVALSNYLVEIIINDWLTWAAFTYPLCFLVTDLTNRLSGTNNAKKVVFAGFMLGVVLSLILATPRIALASGCAFLTAQLLDITIFNRLRDKTWWQAPLFSSSIGSLVDTLLFFSLAFAYTDVPWVSLALGDYAAKAFMFTVLLPVYKLVCQYALSAPLFMTDTADDTHGH